MDIAKFITIFCTLILGNSVGAQNVAIAIPIADPITRTVPFQAFKIKRNDVFIASNSPILPCDQLIFDTNQTQFSSVRFDVFRGGRQLVLTPSKSTEQLSCDKSTLSDASRKLWIALSGNIRNEIATPATSRSGPGCDEQIAVPVFTPPQTNIAVGKRSLVVPWVNGCPPFRVVMENSDTGKIVAEVTVLNGQQATLPHTDIKEGKYNITVWGSPKDATKSKSQLGQSERNVFAVTATNVPPIPLGIAQSDLTAPEKDLLYSYHLEALLDGRWTFEAFQYLNRKSDGSPPILEWLSNFTSGR